MAISRNSNSSLNSPVVISPKANQQLKRFTYIGVIPVLAIVLLAAMFGLMGVLPSLAEAQAGILYAIPNGSTSASCAVNAPCDLQTAVSNALAGNEVRAASGTYTSTAPISITQSISLTGGYIYSGGSTWSADASLYNITTLDGENTRRVLEIAAGISPAITNFHIEHGAATNGAGIYVAKGTGNPFISTNIIRNNSATGGKGGGGIYEGGASTIENNEIYNNTTTGGSGGGGILVDNSTATLSTTIRFNRIYNNLANGASSYGGGIFLDINARASLIANTIYDNTGKVGGGLGALNPQSVTMISNMFYDNEATGFNATTSLGGGVSLAGGQSVLWNNTFVGNIADDGGAGIYLEDTTANISNNIIAFNTGNGNDGIHDSGAPASSVTGGYNNVFNDIVDASITLSDPVAGDPDFVNFATRNLHINEFSPAQDAGDPDTPTLVAIDIDGQDRPYPTDGNHDIGADEFYPNFAAFEIVPPSTENIVERGAIEQFNHTIKNVGTVEDRYNIACTSNLFTVTVCASQTVSVSAGSSVQIATSVEIPTNLTPYQVGTTIITATSQVSNTVSDAALVRSTVAPHPGLSFTPNYSRTELPGEVITLTHVITNTGDYFEKFVITEIDDVGDTNWGILLPTDPYIIGINKGASRIVQVQVTIPDFAPQGLENVMRFQASSEFDPSISATVVNTITAKATTGIRYVRFGGIDTDNNCTQSNNACGSVKHAVGQAASGDEVRIAPGTFSDSNINVNDTIHISGGWINFSDVGQGEEPDPTKTIINAGGNGPVFVIGAGKPTIGVLTMQNGRNANGGAVFVNSNTQPEFNNVVFDNNVATNNGGAVFINAGTGTAVTVRKGHFTNNNASGGGGAVYMNGGILSLYQSQFITNTTGSSGGGALTLINGSLTAQNNMFSNNTTSGSGGGVRLNNGTATFNFNTWSGNTASGNGGGVYNNGATTTIQNSILANNTAVSGSAIFENAGTTNLDYLNLWQNDTNIANEGVHSFTADPLFADDQLRLGDGSLAIDTADPNSSLKIDFEDDFRPSDEGYDIGYDERAGCLAKRDDVVYGSIQDAVDVDNDDILIKVSGICRGVHTIDVGSDPISQTVHLTKSVIIQGGWDSEFGAQFKDPTLVDPEGRGRGFYITDGVSVTIEGLTVTNGSAVGLGGGPADEDAGGIFYNVDGVVTLNGVRILTGTAEIGGGFYNESGAPRLTWLLHEKDDEEIHILTEIAGSNADSGGGVYNNSGSMVLDGAWLHHNQATDNGGGLFNLTGPMTVVNTILDNNAASLGAGLYNEAATSAYLHNTVYSNIATTNGGGIYNAAGLPTLANNIFESNQAASGSAIYDEANAVVDYNYYYLNSGTAVAGNAVTGTHSIETNIIAPGLTDPTIGDFHLLDDAPAADVGDPVSPVTTDFDDDPRPSNQAVDMGADEIVGCLAQLNGDKIYGSLQAAINDAQPGDEIKVSGKCSGVHMYDPGASSSNVCNAVMLTAVHIDKELTITGGWDEDFREQQDGEYSILDAKEQGRVLYIGQGISTTISGFDMINGAALHGAGVCIDDAKATLQNNRIYSNTANTNGGGLYVIGSGSMTSTLQNNFVFRNNANTGAGAYNNSGDHAYWHNTFYGNIAGGNGGAYYITAGTPDIRGSILMANEANSGGAIYAVSEPIVDFNDYFENSPNDFGGNISVGGPGSIAADPGFSNIISGYFTITIDSPVVDFDIPNMPVLIDFEGDLRPSHQGYDMGADEVGGCFATIMGAEETVYGSVQLAVDLASDGDTILVDGICLGVNSRQIAGNQVSQSLALTKSVTIDGSWDYPDDTSEITTTIDALNNGRVVYVAEGANITVTNIILRQGDANGAGNGNNGGGVYNATTGFLTLVDAWVQENTAVSGGGIYNGGTLVVMNTGVTTNTASQDGGGLYNNTANGLLTTIQGSKIRGNRMGDNGDGGGIYHQAGALMINGNRIYINGFEGSPGGDGGGIYLNSGTTAQVDVRNNFIYDNWANEGGGLYNANTNGRLWHNTFYGNTALNNFGGGLASTNGSPDIRNNIVDSNSGYGIYTQNGSPTINFNDAVNNSLDDIFTDVAIGANNISAPPTYISVFAEDFHLYQGSAGEDAGDPQISDNTEPNYVDDDIDGHMRPTNSGPDMGADEIDSCRVRVGDTIFSVLQDAIDYAESTVYNTVEIARGECRGTFERSGTRQVAYISQDMNIIGSLRRLDFTDPIDFYNDEVGTNSTIINANGEGRVFRIANSATVVFTHIAIVNGDAFMADASNNDDGGGVYNDGDASFYQVYLCNNAAENGAGYYSSANSYTYMTGTTIGTCFPAQVTEDRNTGAVISARRLAFAGNVASIHGGGAYFAGDANLRNMGILQNLAGMSGTSGNGGGIYNARDNNELVNNYFNDNVTLFDGGGLYNEGEGMSVLHNTLRNNYAVNNGGGIANSAATFELNSSILYSNTAGINGGGVSTVNDNAFTYNNYYDNVPNDSSAGLGTNAFTWDPVLRGYGLWKYRLSVNSPNIDQANPALLAQVDYDIDEQGRPDGDPFLNYQPPHGIRADIGADEYFKDFGCEIEPPIASRTANPGDVVTYTLSIINAGNPPYTNLEDGLAPRGYTDTISITLSSQTQGWSIFEGGEEQLVELGWKDNYPNGAWVTRVLTVTVPEDAQVGRGETTIIQCQSTSLPERVDTTTINTDVGLAGGVLVIPDEVGTAVPGQVLTYTKTIINQQNVAADYLLTPSSGPRHANAVLLDTLTLSPTANITVSLAPKDTASYTTTALLEITILDTATAGEVAAPELIAEDVTNKNIQNAASHQITILPIPGTRYVADIGADTTNCTDPLQPCETIQHAIDQAVAGDEVRIAAGTYTHYTTETVGIETVQQNVFIDKSLTLAGGYSASGDDPFTVQEPITNAVILDGEGARRVIYVTDGLSVTLSSVFIENGSSAEFGGGIYNAGADLTVYSTWIQGNTSAYGAGIFHTDGLLTLYSSILYDNANPEGDETSYGEGGGLYMAAGTGILENNTFVGNAANRTGSKLMPNAVSTAHTGFGGAIFLDDTVAATVTNNIFSENNAQQGTAIYISNTATITNSFNLFSPIDAGNTNTIVGAGYGTGSIQVANPGFIGANDYHIQSTSPAKDTGTPTVTISQSVDIDLESRIMGPGIDIGADERTQKPGFVFAPAVLSATIDSGTVITYNHQITNTGDFTDSYSLSLISQIMPPGDGSWAYSFSPPTITDLESMGSVAVTLVVTGGQPGFAQIATITADSLSGLSRSVVDTTTISQTAGVDIEQSSAQIGLPGELITYAHTLTNTGNGIDQFELTTTAVPTDWLVTITPTQTGFLAPLETLPFTVTVLIPADAISSTQHQVEVTAVATEPDASDTLTDTTTVGLVSGLTLVPDYDRFVPDGIPTIYTHTLTSGSNITDTVNLTVTGSLPWDVAIEPTPVTLNPFESRIVSMTVTVPPNTGGLIHVAQITATSSLPGITASATDTTTVDVETGILFTPSYTRVVNADTTEVYTHTLTNQGNTTDTFALSESSTQGWLVSMTASLVEVAPGASVPITAVVTVPFGTLPATEDILTLTATSQNDNTTTGLVTDTTRVIQRHELAFYPDRTDVADAGTTKVYTHTLENLGDGIDTFDLTASGTPNWLITLSQTPITLDPLESTTVVVTLTIPSGASGLTNISHITATSTISPAFSAMVTDTTTISGSPAILGVLIEPDRMAIGNLNDTLTYYHVVTNTGDTTDDIGLSIASGWTAIVTPTQILNMPAGASAPVTVTVTIPAVAAPGEEDLAVVTAVSLSEPSASDTVTDTSRVLQNHGLLFFPDNAQTVNAGSTVVYTHTLHNTGNGTDTFAITPNSAWPVVTDSPITLAADEEATIFVTLTVPAGTEGQIDVMQVTASSVISPAFSAMVTDTTTVSGTTPGATVEITPDYTDYGVAGDTMQYVHTVINTGSGSATFDVSWVSSLRWLPTVIPSSLTLGAGETGLVTVTVIIPPGTNVGERDVTTITVTAQNDASITDSATDTTIIPGVFLPIIVKAPTIVVPPTPTPGPTPTNTPTATPPSCTIPTGKDLVVTEIRVVPAVPTAGVPAVVYVTIHNQGSVSVAPSNNFYADFYVDRVPAIYLHGDIEWGAQGEWMGAGQSYTLSGNYTFSGGSHQLYAQVDTDNWVDECPFDNNNVRGPQSLPVSGAANVGGQENPAQKNEGPRNTPTPVNNADVEPVITERPLSTPTPTITVTPVAP